MKSLDTLIEDIYTLFDQKDMGPDRFDPKLFEEFGGSLRDMMDQRFHRERKGEPRLYMSNIGKPDRQVWMDMNSKGVVEEILPHTMIKFSYGDIIEHMVLLYARMAGHTVEGEQDRVVIKDVSGRMDAVIDGVVVDVKSASTFSFKKFKDGSLLQPGNDPFGYVAQLAGYVRARTPGGDGAFLAVDKTTGALCLLRVPAAVLEAYDVEKRIDHMKEVVASPDAPAHCYPPVPDGKSGNMKLGVGCSYCKHKFACWPGLKMFHYSSGPRFLTKVVREPRVEPDAGQDFPE